MLILVMLQVRLYSSIPKKYTMKTYFVDFVMELSRIIDLHWHVIHTSFCENWLFGLQEMGETLYAWWYHKTDFL